MIAGLDSKNSRGGTRLGRGHEFEMMDPDAEDIRAAATFRVPVPMPERRLREAVLFDAIDMLQKGRARFLRADPYDKGTNWRRDYGEAKAWVENDDTEHPFGFIPLCEILGLDAQAARAEILNGMPVIPLEPEGPRHRPLLSSRSRRLWAWACEQSRPWTSQDAADGVRENTRRVVGLISHWVRDGRLLVVFRPGKSSRYGASTYQVAP